MKLYLSVATQWTAPVRHLYLNHCASSSRSALSFYFRHLLDSHPFRVQTSCYLKRGIGIVQPCSNRWSCMLLQTSQNVITAVAGLCKLRIASYRVSYSLVG